jgi:hypothetical protein
MATSEQAAASVQPLPTKIRHTINRSRDRIKLYRLGPNDLRTEIESSLQNIALNKKQGDRCVRNVNNCINMSYTRLLKNHRGQFVRICATGNAIVLWKPGFTFSAIRRHTYSSTTIIKPTLIYVNDRN